MRFIVLLLAFASTGLAAEQCATCHSKIAATFAKTGMARSFSKPGPMETIRFHHQPSDTWYAVVERGGQYYQRRWRIGYSGQETEVQEQRIDYVLGSGNHVRTYLHLTERGKLVELPLAWYAENGGTWAMNPGHDRDYALPPRAVAYECMFCHNSYPSIPAGHETPGSEPLYAGALPEGIGCARCHGPGESHERLAQTAGAKVEGIRKAIVNPARLTKARQMEVCMQCHLETTTLALPHSIVKYGRDPFSYQPNEPLSDFMLFYDYPRRDDFEIAHSAYRLRKSRCFLESKGAMTCTTCHDPHDVPRADNAVCSRCHATLPVQHTKAPDCITCHMPKRRTQDVVHAVMTDHYIQRRPPPNLLAPLKERLETYNGKVVPYYPTPGDPLYNAIANAKAAPAVLAAEIAKQQPTRPEPYVELGEALTGNSRNAKAAFEQALKRKPLMPSALLNAATPELLKQSAGDDPLLWYQAGEFEKALALDPDLAIAHNDLGEQLAGAGQMQRAEEEFRAALRSEPDLPAAQSNLGHVLAERGDLAQAAWYFQRAVRRSPKDADLHVNYAATLRGLNRPDEALRELEAALKLKPAFGLAHLNIAEILMAKGDAAGARAHLLQAAKNEDPEVRRRATQRLNESRTR
jgi:Flp pilus assembly protein TadD